MTADTYNTRAEANKDHFILKTLSGALDISERNIKKDDCKAWHIPGHHGSIYTWADDTLAWVLYIACDSPRAWTLTKKKLRFLPVTQDGDQEGCFKIEGIPNPEHAKIIREALGLRKKAVFSDETRKRMQERITSVNSRRLEHKEQAV